MTEFSYPENVKREPLILQFPNVLIAKYLILNIRSAFEDMVKHVAYLSK